MMNSSEVHFTGKVALKAVIVSPLGKVLVCRNHEDDVWDLPGGTLNAGEHPEAGLLREIKEELNIVPTLMRPLKVDYFIKPVSGNQVIVIILEASYGEEKTIFEFDHTEIAEAKWISRDTLSTIKLFPEYHRLLESYFASK